MAESRCGGNTLRGEPLYIFYDCEATGINVETDRLIEIGAILCTENLTPRTAQILQQDNQFMSLCHCTHPINPESAKVLTLTLQDLQGAPSIVEVLNQFCLWIRERVRMAEQIERKSYTPLLVAHSGNLLDYPLLFSEIKRAHSFSLERVFEDLNLHYADSYTVVRQLSRKNSFYRSLPGLGVKDLHQGLLQTPHEGHRALPDALALHNMFTQCERSKKLEFFAKVREVIHSKQSFDLLREQIPKFRNARIDQIKAEMLLLKGITYERIHQEYHQRSPEHFEWYLQDTCEIKKPRKVFNHFMYSD